MPSCHQVSVGGRNPTLVGLRQCRGVWVSVGQKTGLWAAVSDDFAARNACSWSGDDRNSFLVLSNGRSGPSRPASVSVLAANWLAIPKKARRSVRLEGVGNLAIASVMAKSMLYPSWDRLNPANVTWGCAYSHLSELRVILRSVHLAGRTCSVCWVRSLS